MALTEMSLPVDIPWKRMGVSKPSLASLPTDKRNPPNSVRSCSQGTCAHEPGQWSLISNDGPRHRAAIRRSTDSVQASVM